jgi:hypothetical protein
MSRITYIPNRVIDANGIADGAAIYVYQSGGTTPVPLFSDVGYGTPVSNPYVVTSGALVPALFTNYEGDIRVRIVSSKGVVVSDDDPYGSIVLSSDLSGNEIGQGSDLVAFKPPLEGAVATTVTEKLAEFVSVKDFGAVGDGSADDTAAIQAALDTGKNVLIPDGIFLLSGNLTPQSNQRIFGTGPNSVLKLNGAVASGVFDAVGTEEAPLRRIELSDFTIEGDCTFSGGFPSINNGDAIDFQFTDECRFTRLIIKGFNANGIAVANGSWNIVSDCDVESCGQSIAFYSNAISPEGNQIIGNRVRSNGRYNAVHLEGSAGAPELGEGAVIGTIVSGNFVSDSYGHGINIEVAPRTVCIGNTVLRSGPGEEEGLDVGIFVYASPFSVIVGNVSADNHSYGIIIAAGSNNCSVSANTTFDNDGGSLLITDSVRPGGPPFAVTLNQEVGLNNFNEGALVLEGNASIRPPAIVGKGAATVETVQRVDSTNMQRLWLAPNDDILWREGINVEDTPGGIERQWWRNGVVVLSLTAAGYVKPNLPIFADNAAAVAGGLTTNSLYKLATGEVRAVV